jgi:hypothetical protein
MPLWERPAVSTLAVGALFLLSSCTHQQPIVSLDTATLAQLSSEYGQGGHPAGPPSVKQIAEKQTPVSDDLGSSEEEYKSEIAAFLVEKDYDKLEKTAHEARTGKTRFNGGVWKLLDVYEALAAPIVGPAASEEDWKFHIASLKAWESARPESVTAMLALAETYVSYADKARGTGYADTVSEAGWKLHNERIAMSASTLAEAAKLKEKCPYWYEVMQHVALSQGWGKAQARKLLDDAIAFEPTYYHYYREYANFLLPKWYGQPGETEAFAEDTSNQIGGQEGKFVYFEIAGLASCQCDSDDSHMQYLSWPRIKEGYAALGQLYGYSNLKRNRFAHMAVEANDKPAAQQAFAMIGDDWDHTVWRSSRNFESAKNWAEGQ